MVSNYESWTNILVKVSPLLMVVYVICLFIFSREQKYSVALDEIVS